MGFASSPEETSRRSERVDEERAQRARLFLIASTVIVIALSIFLLYYGMFDLSYNIVPMFAVLVLALFSIVLHRRGFSDPAVFVLLGSLLAGLFVLAVLNNGMYDTALQALPAVLIAAAMLLPIRQLAFFAALPLLLLFVLGILQVNNILLIPPRPPMNGTDVFDLMVINTATVIGVVLISTYLRETLSKLRDRDLRLSESEERFRLTMEATNDGLWDWDIRTDSGYFSPGYYRMLGYDDRSFEARGELWKELIHPDDCAYALQANTDCIEGRSEHFEIEYRLKHRDGEWRWILGRGKCVARDERGRALRLVGTHVDITERKRAEEALRINEQRLHDIMFSGADWVWEIDEHGVYTYSSEKGFQLFGPSREDVIGKTPFDFMAPEEAKRVGAIFSGIAANKLPIKDLENWNIRKNGEPICLLTNGVPILDEQGNLKGYRGVDKDITERKKWEEALRTSETKLRAILDNSVDAIGVHVDGIWEMCNPAAVRLFGVSSSSDLIGTPILNVITPAERSRISEFVRNRTGGITAPSSYVTRGLRLDGSEFDMDVTLSMFSIDEKNHVLVILRDITEVKRAEAALRTSEEKFRRAFTTSPDAVNLNRLSDGMYVSINEGFTKILGYTEAEIIGKTSLEMNIWADPADRIPFIDALSKDGRVENYVARFRAKDGTLIYGEIAASIMEHGGIKHILSIVRNINDRKRIEKTMQESEQKFKSTFMTSLDAICIATLEEGRIIEVNDAFEEVFGYTKAETIGKTSLELNLYNDPADRASIDAALKAHGRVRDLEIKGRKKNGDCIVVSMSVTILPLGNKSHIVGVIRDITERKRAEEELMQRMNELTTWHKVTVGREGRVIELKNEVNELLTKLGQGPRYKSTGV